MNSTIDSDALTTSEKSTAQKTNVEATLRSLRTLLDGDQQEQQETLDYLKKALDSDRSSERKLFQS